MTDESVYGLNDNILYWTLGTDPITGAPIAVPVENVNARGWAEPPWSDMRPRHNLHDDPELNRARVARIGGAQQ